MTMLLPGFFDADQQVVLKATERDPTGHPRDKLIPSNFLPSKLRPSIANPASELEKFEFLLEKLVQLARPKFEVLIECMRGFKRSILAIKLDHHLAYSSLVFCLESLAQRLPTYEATWDDVPEPDKTRIERSIADLPLEKADEIKTAIIEDRQLRLTKRFVEFVVNNVRTPYYTTEAAGINNAIRPTELEPCLKAAYRIRSGYTHSLTNTVEHLQIPVLADGETFTWEGQAVPTFRGLARLLEHVIRTIILEANIEKPEDIHFTQIVPGIITMKLAPKHALARYKEFKPGWAQHVLCLIASHVWHLPAAKEGEGKVVLVEEFVEDAVAKFGQANPIDRLCILNIIRIYQSSLGDGMKENWQNLLQKHGAELCKPVWPNVVTFVLVGGKLDENGDAVLEAVGKLRRLATKKPGPDLPKDIALVASAIGISMIYLKDPDRAKELNHAVVLEAAGRPKAQELIKNIDRDYSIEMLQRALLGVETPQTETGVAQTNSLI
jgi:hypothetical protein